MSKILVRTSLAILVLAAIAYGIFAWTAPDPVPVRTVAVERGTVERVVANTRAGTVRARRRSRLAPAVAGRVVALPVDEGDEVAEGDLLLELWSKDLRAELQLARAEVTQAEAVYEETCERAQLAAREAERIRSLSESGIRSPENLDRAVVEAEALAAACRASQAGREVRSARVGTLEARLEQLSLHAPFAGVIAEVNAELGEFVTPSPVGIPTPPAIDIFDRSSLYVEAPLDEVDAPAVRPGMPVRITLDALRGREFAGTVTRVAPYVLEVEKQARTVAVDVHFDDEEAATLLLPGYSADIEVVLDEHDDTLRIPTGAIVPPDLSADFSAGGVAASGLDADLDGGHTRGNDRRRVFVFDPTNDSVRLVHIEIGIESWRYTEVLSGLEAGDLVVANPEEPGLADGVPVRADREDLL